VSPLVFLIKDVKEHGLYLIMASAAEIRNKNIELLQKVVAEEYYVLIVTTNQPFDILKKNYEKNGVPLDRIQFIDTVTKYAVGRDLQPVKNCRFINNPANLTDIGIAMTEILKYLEGKKTCLLFDSVNSMLIYISSQNITKFIHFITNKLRLMNFSGIFLVVEKGLDPDVLVQLTTFVDEVIDLDKIPTKES
jgi:hypothetical protein